MMRNMRSKPIRKIPTNKQIPFRVRERYPDINPLQQPKTATENQYLSIDQVIDTPSKIYPTKFQLICVLD